MSNSKIWVVGERRGAEISPWTLQLVSGAASIATDAGIGLGVLLEAAGDDEALELAAHGATDVTSIEGAAPARSVEAVVAAANSLLATEQPAALLFLDSIFGKDAASQVSAAAGVSLVSACERFAHAEGSVFTAIRSCFGGQLSQRVRIASSPCIATVREHAFRAKRVESLPAPNLRSLKATHDERITVLERRPPRPETLDLAEAEVLVAGGRGLGEDGFRVLEEVARALGGTTAASRAAVDEGWADSTKQVGQTGRTVAPRLYIACGISGAIQHMVGVRDAGALIALNTDRSAPIMADADLAAVGDASEVLAQLVGKLDAGATS
jgi:electron transfer flavoprotein alpha subunit